jgi:hypothetical protein
MTGPPEACSNNNNVLLGSWCFFMCASAAAKAGARKHTSLNCDTLCAHSRNTPQSDRNSTAQRQHHPCPLPLQTCLQHGVAPLLCGAPQLTSVSTLMLADCDAEWCAAEKYAMSVGCSRHSCPGQQHQHEHEWQAPSVCPTVRGDPRTCALRGAARASGRRREHHRCAGDCWLVGFAACHVACRALAHNMVARAHILADLQHSTLHSTLTRAPKKQLVE